MILLKKIADEFEIYMAQTDVVRPNRLCVVLVVVHRKEEAIHAPVGNRRPVLERISKCSSASAHRVKSSMRPHQELSSCSALVDVPTHMATLLVHHHIYGACIARTGPPVPRAKERTPREIYGASGHRFLLR